MKIRRFEPNPTIQGRASHMRRKREKRAEQRAHQRAARAQRGGVKEL
jgi:hypothetical protein